MKNKKIKPTVKQITDSENKMLTNLEIFDPKTSKGRALITGASSGIGEEFCWQLAAKGHDLVIVARNKEKLETMAEEISQIAGVEVEVLVADLSEDKDIEKVSTRLKDTKKPVDLLVNNAGFAVAQPFVGGQLQRELYALKVLVEAPLRLSHASVEAMIPRGRGAIINVASIAAFSAMGTYASAKSWLVTFTKSLATEVKEHGIYVSALCPGLVKTNFHNAPSIKDARWPKFLWCNSQEVVETALLGLNEGKVIVVPNWKYKIAYMLLKFAPERMVRKFAGHSASANAQF